MTTMVLLSEWMSSQVEFWRPIPGWGMYDASNWGRIRSYWKTTSDGFTFYHTLNRQPRILSPPLGQEGLRKGYLT